MSGRPGMRPEITINYRPIARAGRRPAGSGAGPTVKRRARGRARAPGPPAARLGTWARAGAPAGHQKRGARARQLCARPSSGGAHLHNNRAQVRAGLGARAPTGHFRARRFRLASEQSGARLMVANKLAAAHKCIHHLHWRRPFCSAGRARGPAGPRARARARVKYPRAPLGPAPGARARRPACQMNHQLSLF